MTPHLDHAGRRLWATGTVALALLGCALAALGAWLPRPAQDPPQHRIPATVRSQPAPAGAVVQRRVRSGVAVELALIPLGTNRGADAGLSAGDDVTIRFTL